ncbi:MAG TPA: prepilin-type N-terminal cleavage/methylation domain-containing protein [Phycisphaerales bacterium]|nr:prepilin-type N-terminal cleavage/methylation domain-containing protein [Phycisphaerales bacterium]HRQ75054.1 prepilin-type N-terminal cleavage/methylation domain-containing protein [Phycisphaerales bacterium]
MLRIRRPSRIARGFSLIELIVVIAILAILATMTVPRLLGNQDRQFRATCDQVADMLTMYARRDSLAEKPIGLMYDEARRWLIVTVYDMEQGSESKAYDWRWDRYIQPVKLPDFVHLGEVRIDGSRVDITNWPYRSRPGHERPMIEIVLDGPEESITIALASYAVTPRQFRDGASANFPMPIDLNAAGQMREDW